MEEIYISSIRKILSNKKKLEQELDITIQNRGKLVFVESKHPLNEYLACKIFEALNLGFKIEQALLLKNEEYQFEKIPIKETTKRKSLSQVRARIIGKKGKTLELLQTLSNCFIVLHNNIVGIIGRCEEIVFAIRAIESLIRGSRQGNVYSYLEKQRRLIKTSI